MPRYWRDPAFHRQFRHRVEWTIVGLLYHDAEDIVGEARLRVHGWIVRQATPPSEEAACRYGVAVAKNLVIDARRRRPVLLMPEPDSRPASVSRAVGAKRVVIPRWVRKLFFGRVQMAILDALAAGRSLVGLQGSTKAPVKELRRTALRMARRLREMGGDSKP